ncbi:ribonuclease H-like domain, reverse transcriptase, RNA-dependent DNA polymerase [Tanacetum coccineum]
MFRTDRGGEFNSNEFTQYCKENGIARQLIPAALTHPAKWSSRKRNRTIMSTTRCMMKATEMPQDFWAEAVRHAIYILNSVPTKALEDITPYEAIKGKKPNLKDLRVFGCIAYAKVPSQHLTKLDDRSIRMRDVKFKENEKKWDWSKYLENHPNEEDNDFPYNDDDGYDSPLADSPAETLHTPLTRSPQINSQTTPNQSDDGIPTTTETQSHFDHTPIRGYRTLTDIYENTEELLLAEDEPKNYKEASNDQKWIEAMKDELDSINRNNTWRLTSLPPGHKAIGLKWVFKTKRDADGKIIKHKARLVAKGYIQEHGIDFEEVFAPVARMETIRLLLAIAANNKWQVHHLDVKSAFLHGDLQEEVTASLEHHTLKSLDFKKCALEQAIYTRTERESILLVGVYVDDLIITGTPKREIDKFKDQMKEIFEMSDLGLLAYYLGIEVTQSGGDISIKQSAYARKILKEAGMLESNETIIPMDPGTRLMKTAEGTMVNSTEYRSLIGCLRYLLHTRPDLSYSVGLLSRFMQEPKEQHMKAIKKVLRYVKGTKDYGITYKHNGATASRRRKQYCFKRLLSRLTHSDEEKITILVDNKSAIALMKNPVFHGRSKHIDTKYHFIRECVERDDIQVEFVSGRLQKALTYRKGNFRRSISNNETAHRN